MRVSTVRDALSDAMLRASQAESAFEDQMTLADRFEADLRDRDSVIESLRNEIKFSAEHSRVLLHENTTLQADARSADSELALACAELATARNRIEALERETRRVGLVNEEQAGQLARLAERRVELEAAVEQERQGRRMIEAQLAAAKQAGEGAGLDAHDAERARLIMTLRAAENAKSAAEGALVQLRDRLREREDASRTLDRDLRDARIGRESAERRLDGARTDLARHGERMLELQQRQVELSLRSEALAKTVSARDAALDQLAARNAKLTEQLEQAAARHEAVRAELRRAAQTHADDLQVERAERALMQRALEIARGSRASLQKRHDALRRTSHGAPERRDDDAPAAPRPDRDAASNVHPLYGAK